MADNFNVRKVSRIWTATNTQVNETTSLFTVNYGDIVLQAVARVVVAGDATNAAVQLGDGNSANRFLTAAEVGVASTGLKTGSGANDLAGAGYYVYVANDTLDVTYTGDGNGTLATKPTVRFTCWILDSEPV